MTGMPAISTAILASLGLSACLCGCALDLAGEAYTFDAGPLQAEASSPAVDMGNALASANMDSPDADGADGGRDRGPSVVYDAANGGAGSSGGGAVGSVPPPEAGAPESGAADSGSVDAVSVDDGSYDANDEAPGLPHAGCSPAVYSGTWTCSVTASADSGPPFVQSTGMLTFTLGAPEAGVRLVLSGQITGDAMSYITGNLMGSVDCATGALNAAIDGTLSGSPGYGAIQGSLTGMRVPASSTLGGALTVTVSMSPLPCEGTWTAQAR